MTGENIIFVKTALSSAMETDLYGATNKIFENTLTKNKSEKILQDLLH